MSSVDFGKYRLLGMMNAGGMAELYLAQASSREGFSKVVALKRILPHLSESDGFVQMFLDEARLASRLDHPNIARIYELGELDAHYYMTMEYLPGEDLARVFKAAQKNGHRVPQAIAAAIVQDAAHGLHFAHELTDSEGRSLHLVHRDVTPSNVIVTYHGAVKLVDFGIAKARTNTHQTVAGTIRGKLAYLSPEQLKGEAPDRRSDVFSLGIVLWELLAGERLFVRSNDAATLRAVSVGEIPELSTIRPDVAPELVEVVKRALARDPAERYQTAGEMYDDIERYFANQPRPSPKIIAGWLEELFGDERAQAKRQIAQGTHLTRSVSLVMREVGDEVRRTPSGKTPRGRFEVTVEATPPGTRRRKQRAHRSWRWAVAIAGAAVLSLLTVAALRWGSSDVQTPISPAYAALELSTQPPGAHVLVNGEPTGLSTPVVLEGLAPNQFLEVRLEKPGFAPVYHRIVLRPGAREKRSSTMQQQLGYAPTEQFAPVARVRVDEEVPSGGDPKHGAHAIVHAASR